MANPSTKNQIIGIVATTLFHIAILLILIFITFSSSPTEGEEGILVQVGTIDATAGNFTPQQPEVRPTPPQPEVEPTTTPEPEIDEPNINQELEETIALANKKKEEEERKRQEQEKLEAEKRKQEELKRKTEQAQNLVANAFSNTGKPDDSNGTTTTKPQAGDQGSVDGNASQGATSGVGGYGEYDLGGRSISGALPRPSYDTSNDFGTIVIAITVNPAGKVINALATLKGSEGTAYYNPKLRASAEQAAKNAVFKQSNEAGNQSGTIIYHFRQK